MIGHSPPAKPSKPTSGSRKLKECGKIIARVITDGPDEDFEKFRWALLAALAEAQTSVQIVTPYFLPDTALVTGLNLAAMRGVRVDILLPAKNNLPFMHWASRAMWWQVLKRGCHIWLTPPPFDHSKLMIVDGHWVLLGSANWDARSLRLNFELNLECYGHDLAGELETVIQRKLHGAHEVTLGGSERANVTRETARRHCPVIFAVFIKRGILQESPSGHLDHECRGVVAAVFLQ